MDNIVFYRPPSAQRSRPRSSGATAASNASGGPIASFPIRQTSSQPNQRNGISKNEVNGSREANDLSQRSHTSDRCCRNDTVQDQVTLNSPNCNNDDDFPEISELLFGMQQNDSPTKMNANSRGMAEMLNWTGSRSPDYSRPTAGSSQDPIVLSDSESTGVVPETDYSDLDIALEARSDSDPPHVVDSQIAGGFSSGAALISDRLGTDHQEGNNNHNNNVVDKPQLRLLADRRRPASPDPRSDTLLARNLHSNTDITHGSTGYGNLDATGEGLKDKSFNFFAKEDGNDDNTLCTKGQTLRTVSDKNPASYSNISRLQDGQPYDTQFPQLALAAASSHKSASNDLLLKQFYRSAPRNDHCKRSRIIAPTKLAAIASTASAVPESANLEPKLRDQIVVPDEEWEVRNIDQEIVESTNDSDVKNYASMSGTAGSKRGSGPHPRKRARRTTEEQNNSEDCSTHSLDVPCQAAEASSRSMPESEEMPIHGYFTLKIVSSKVMYCLTFSQELLPRPEHQRQRRYCTTDLDKLRSAASVADPNSQWEIRKIVGQKMVGHERHYRVEWEDTWMPESELAGAKELVDAFMANDRSGAGGRKRSLKRSWPFTGQSDARDEEGLKKRRGRPRKHT